MCKQECWRQYLVFPQCLRYSLTRWRCPPCTGECAWTSSKKNSVTFWARKKGPLRSLQTSLNPRAPTKSCETWIRFWSRKFHWKKTALETFLWVEKTTIVFVGGGSTQSHDYLGSWAANSKLLWPQHSIKSVTVNWIIFQNIKDISTCIYIHICIYAWWFVRDFWTINSMIPSLKLTFFSLRFSTVGRWFISFGIPYSSGAKSWFWEPVTCLKPPGSNLIGCCLWDFTPCWQIITCTENIQINNDININDNLGGGFNPIEKIKQSKWTSSPNRDEHNNYLSCHHRSIPDPSRNPNDRTIFEGKLTPQNKANLPSNQHKGHQRVQRSIELMEDVHWSSYPCHPCTVWYMYQHVP